MKKLIILSVFLLLNALLFAQNTWYVRPAFTGQTYGTEDGTSYENAWNGLEILNGKFQDGTIGPTDEIYICGRHVFHDTLPYNLIAIQGKIGIKSGQDSLHHLVIRGDYPGDSGIIWGHSRMDYEDWNNRGNNVWSIGLHASYTYNWYFQDIETTDPENPIILGVANDFSDLENSPGKMYLPPPYDSLFVHLTDNGNPTHRVYSYFFGYSFDWDKYINNFAPLHFITFKNLTLYAVSGLPSQYNHHHLRWDGCKIAWERNYGISFWKGQDYNEVVNCDIGWCGNGVYGIDNSDEGGANHIVIKDNHFHDIGVLPEQQNSDEHAIGLQGGTGWIIEDNYIERCGSGPLLYAFTNQRLTNMVIRYNFIKDCDPDGSATGYGIATQCNNNSFSDKSGIEIYNNIVVNCKVGIRLQFEDVQDCYNNTIYGCESSFASGRNYAGKGARVNFKNNISANAGLYHIHWFSGADTISLRSDYNLFDIDGPKFYWVYVPDYINERNFAQWQALQWDSCTFDPHSVLDIPLFENSSGTFSEPGDFKLTATSPAIDAGIDVGLVTDFAGNPIVGMPDIGAYEFQDPLAIEYLTPLRVIPLDNNVMLNWTSANEQNNDYFMVQRSMDGHIWKDIGKVKGKGNTLSSHFYKMVDLKPGIGTLYYRLKQYDYDGTFSYSNIASVYFEETDFNIYPNPTSGRIELVVQENVNTPIQVFDTQGKVVLQQLLNGNHTTLDLSNLPDGTYLIGLKKGDKMVMRKLVLQR